MLSCPGGILQQNLQPNKTGKGCGGRRRKAFLSWASKGQDLEGWVIIATMGGFGAKAMLNSLLLAPSNGYSITLLLSPNTQ